MCIQLRLLLLSILYYYLSIYMKAFKVELHHEITVL